MGDRVRHIVGCMTGTSLDAVDAACVAVRGEGLGIAAEVVGFGSVPLGDVAEPLRRLARGEALTAREISGAAHRFACLHVEAIEGVLEGCPDEADFVALHGQTVFHAPPLSWQLLNPWPVARALGKPVVFDLRGADLASGGQGAPITPIADWAMFRDGEERERRAVVNLGGFCNITLLPASGGPEGVCGFDVCGCNHALNEAARLALGKPFDEDGAGAARGEVDSSSHDRLVLLLRRQRGCGRSLGSRDEADARACVGALRARLDPPDLLTTVTDAIACVIAEAVVGEADRVLLAGGSAKHRELASRIGAHAALPTVSIADLGVAPEAREAACMAVLGAMCQDRVPITLPGITGCAPCAPIAGAWIDPRP